MKALFKLALVAWLFSVGIGSYLYCLMLMDGYDKTRDRFCAIKYNFQYVLFPTQFIVCKIFERIK